MEGGVDKAGLVLGWVRVGWLELDWCLGGMGWVTVAGGGCGSWSWVGAGVGRGGVDGAGSVLGWYGVGQS